MANFRQGFYEVKNSQKYVGNGKPKYRSGWEMTFMMFLDSNDNVINWASEPVRIPYRNPLTGKMTCLLYTSPSPRDRTRSRMPSSA